LSRVRADVFNHGPEPDVKTLLQVCLLVLSAVAVAAADEPIGDATGMKLMAKYNCQSCHLMDKSPAGPSLRAIAKKYASDPSARDELEASVLNGSSGAWGQNTMPPNDVPDADLKALIEWILSLR
jgi:cytochrome c551/c552